MFNCIRFLAHDIEEDDEDIKCELYIWALGIQWQGNFQRMIASREALWKAMDHRAIVSRACCDKVTHKMEEMKLRIFLVI